jgi:hypothetical protein
VIDLGPGVVYAENFADGLATVNLDSNQYGYIDHSGQFVWGPTDYPQGRPVDLEGAPPFNP